MHKGYNVVEAFSIEKLEEQIKNIMENWYVKFLGGVSVTHTGDGDMVYNQAIFLSETEIEGAP
jgi:histidinol phosphatase-like PHP family hydrolase